MAQRVTWHVAPHTSPGWISTSFLKPLAKLAPLVGREQQLCFGSRARSDRHDVSPEKYSAPDAAKRRKLMSSAYILYRFAKRARVDLAFATVASGSRSRFVSAFSAVKSRDQNADNIDLLPDHALFSRTQSVAESRSSLNVAKRNFRSKRACPTEGRSSVLKSRLEVPHWK